MSPSNSGKSWSCFDGMQHIWQPTVEETCRDNAWAVKTLRKPRLQSALWKECDCSLRSEDTQQTTREPSSFLPAILSFSSAFCQYLR